MTEQIFYWIGVAVSGASACGVTFLIAVWAMNRVANFFGVTRAMIDAHGEGLRKGREAGKQWVWDTIRERLDNGGACPACGRTAPKGEADQ